MGRQLVEVLVERGDNVFILNRGNEYWGTSNPFGEKVTQVHCERQNVDCISKIRDTLFSGDRCWDAVIDFSAFKVSDLSPFVEMMLNKVRHYVFISTDSVYNVCEDIRREGGKIEEDAIRPNREHEIKRMKNKDNYGHHKLCCEEYLMHMKQKHNFPFTSLRLPDVIGPYDNTDRFWIYQLWSVVSDKYPVYIHEETNERKLSFVLSGDVVRGILSVLACGESVFGQAFNLAHIEQPTLKEFLELVAAAVSVRPNVILVSRNQRKKLRFSEYYPSVDFGPISCAKAMRLLDWKPTPLVTAIEETTKFFTLAWYKYPHLRPLQDFSPDMKEAIIAYYRNKQTHCLESQ